MKKNNINAITFESWTIEIRRVFTRFYILGITDKLFSGRKSRKVLRADTFPMPGMKDNNPVITTMKSSQFQESLKYEFFSMIQPIPIIFKILSKVKRIIKIGSRLLRI